MIGAQGANDQVPKVADFLGVSKSENSSDLVAYNDIQGNDTDYMFTNSSLLPQVENTLSATPTSYELPENASTLQSLTLSMGSGKRSTCETSTGDNTSNDNTTNSTTSVVEANPRRTLDTFGQRTSIYRGVTRWVFFFCYVFVLLSNFFCMNFKILFYELQESDQRFCYMKSLNTGIDGQEDMKLIYGIIVAEEKAKVGKEDKVKRDT